jgi:hypothetical protein
MNTEFLPSFPKSSVEQSPGLSGSNLPSVADEDCTHLFST